MQRDLGIIYVDLLRKIEVRKKLQKEQFMKKLFLFLLPSLIFFSLPSLYADHGYYSSGYYAQRNQFWFCPGCNHYHYGHHRHFQHVYSTGDYYNPRAANYAAHENGAGEHVPTGSIASPYQHGVHHGYHYSPEEGWHSGSHYGHE